MLFFSATVGTNVIAMADLESAAELNVSSVISASGEAYSLSTISITSLRRYSMTMSVFFSSWVITDEVDVVLEAIKTTILEENTELSGMSSISYLA